MRRILFVILVVASLADLALAQNIGAPKIIPSPIAITNGTVYPVSSAPISNATVLIRDGVIVAVGAGISIPADAWKIDATGKIVTPGLINSTTELGLIEISQVRSTNDASAPPEIISFR